jgi:predicted RNA-binding protein with TRAM domain
MRRAGARREVSTRVYLHGRDAQVLEGWALNVSKGGVRVILEDKVELGMEFDVVIGESDTESDGDAMQRGRIVWMQEEPDGVIVGIEFTPVASGTHKSAPPPPPVSDKD